MTENDLRAADPYRPGVIGRLDSEKQALLEEIMADTAAEATFPARHVEAALDLGTTRRLRRRLVGVLVAAVVLTGVVMVVRPDSRPDGGPAPTAPAAAPVPGRSSTPARFSPVAVQAA